MSAWILAKPGQTNKHPLPSTLASLIAGRLKSPDWMLSGGEQQMLATRREFDPSGKFIVNRNEA